MRKGVFWGLVLLAVGALLLLDNFGVLRFLRVSAWQLIWPAFLIGAGIWVLTVATRKPPTYETVSWNAPLENDKELHLTLEYGAGEVLLGSGTGMGDLVSGTFEGGVETDVSRNEDRTRVVLKSTVIHIPWVNLGPSHRHWDVQVNPTIPCQLTLKTGASEAKLDLSELAVSKVRVECGASSVRVQLPRHAGYTEVRGSSGAASLELVVPEGVAARIRSTGGLSSTKVNTARFPKVGAHYESPDFETAQNRVDVLVEMGVGSVTVE